MAPFNNCLRKITLVGLAGLLSTNAFAEESGWSGVVEVEAGSVIADSSVSESDIALATVELGYQHFLTKNTSISVLFLHEDDDTEPAEIDQATINLNDVMGMDMSMGRQYLPFGSYNSGLVSDPLTLEIGETREASFGFSKSISIVTAEAHLFQGDAQVADNAWIPDFMAKISLADEGNINYSLDAYFISELANSESMTGAVSDPTALSHNTGGAGVAAHLGIGALSLDAECLSAIKEYTSDDFGGNKPMACHFELGTTANIANKETSFAIGYGMTNDALDLELPKSRIAAATSMLLTENFALSLEWAMDNDYSTDDGGSGDATHTMTAQVALEF